MPRGEVLFYDGHRDGLLAPHRRRDASQLAIALDQKNLRAALEQPLVLRPDLDGDIAVLDARADDGCDRHPVRVGHRDAAAAAHDAPLTVTGGRDPQLRAPEVLEAHAADPGQVEAAFVVRRAGELKLAHRGQR